MFDYDFEDIEVDELGLFKGSVELSDDYGDCYCESITITDEAGETSLVENDSILFEKLSEILIDRFKEKFYEDLESGETKHSLRTMDHL